MTTPHHTPEHTPDRPPDRKRRLRKTLRKIGRTLHRIEVDVGVLLDDLDYATQVQNDLESRNPHPHLPSPPSWPPSGPGNCPDDAEKALRALARYGVQDVEVTRGGKTPKLRIPGHPTIRVTSGQADILEILIDGDGFDAKGGGTWVTADELAVRLTKRGKGPVSARAVVQRICRLRQRMRDGGMNRYLLQSDRKRGYRFALRPEGPGTTGVPARCDNGPRNGDAAVARIT